MKGGRSYQKVGFVDVNLAEVAGCGKVERTHLLEGYLTVGLRQDNFLILCVFFL